MSGDVGLALPCMFVKEVDNCVRMFFHHHTLKILQLENLYALSIAYRYLFQRMLEKEGEEVDWEIWKFENLKVCS